MAKRIADKELTDRNWDQEDESEEAGTFSVASMDVMKNRPIKKAKRRNLGGESEGGTSFKGFKGFALSASGPAATAAAAPTFSGFGNGASFKPLAGLTNGNGSSTSGGSALAAPAFGSFSSPGATKPSTTLGSLTFNGPSSAAPPLAVGGERQWNGSASGPTGAAVSVGSSSSSSSSINSSSSAEYRRQLTALNCSVRDWITKHVNDNPLCDLNPIFRDYERHLASIEKKYGGGGGGGGGGVGGAGATATGPPASDAKSEAAPAEGVKTGGLQLTSSGGSSTAVSTSSSGTAAPSLFSFSKDASSSTTTTTSSSSSTPASLPSGVTFNFGQKVDSSVLSSFPPGGGAPSFSFSTSSSALSSSSSSTPSLFGGLSSSSGSGGAAAPSAPFSFSLAKTEAPSAAAAPSTADVNGADEDSEEPPVPVVKEIKEKDAFYSKKCKLFYKKESEFKEKGVGTLHLKTVAEGKLQLLVRADTNLGNILLNIMVSSNMPCSRTGKNNVMVVCVPNPAVDDKNPSTPVPMLIRVKTAEDADELHKLMLEKRA
ncbi:hypothetical protein AALO_G00222170 [Alosa alosa]|uniref:Nuclear pore complex protein Nup50 n=1 Tax=Alosa alosa TaxID=278164 RepID=A0AAV6FYF2_9TELE|nr:nuclear pore complex protein Nup50 isoform X1 [Alosa alosa]KAG5267474.1 hypothetical protein AALO_G00222170 [Alosa alosa]